MAKSNNIKNFLLNPMTPVLILIISISIGVLSPLFGGRAHALAGARSKAFALGACMAKETTNGTISITSLDEIANDSNFLGVFDTELNDVAAKNDGLFSNRQEINNRDIGVGVEDFYDSMECRELALDPDIGSQFGQPALMDLWAANSQGGGKPTVNERRLKSYVLALNEYIKENDVSDKEAYERSTQWFAECTTVGSADDNDFVLNDVKYKGKTQDLYYKYNRDIQPIVGEDLVRYLQNKTGGSYASGGSWGVLECGNAEEIGNSLKIYDEDEIARLGADISDSENNSTDDNTDTSPNCENSSGITGWIVCPIIDGAFSIMRVVEGAVVGQLKFTLDDSAQGLAGSQNKIKQGYNSVLVTANILFAVGILWIIISQAITGGSGGGFFGAYEAKKILPKLIAGIIVANLSWELINLLLIFSNALGESVKSIMLSPFQGAQNQTFDFGGWSGVLGGAAAIGAVGMAIFGFFAVSPILIMIILSIVMAIMFAVFRKAIIIVLVVFAPLALAVSPFMPSLFKRYYKLLINLILFYPIVMLCISATTIVGYITIQSAGNADSIASSMIRLAGMAIYFGWIALVLAFAKNNFDVMGKVGGSLQSMGNKGARSFGQKRLEGNQRRIKRDLLADARKKDKARSAYRNLAKSATYEPGENDGRLKRMAGRTRAAYLQNKQAEGIPLLQKEKRARSKAKMVRTIGGQDEELALKAGQEALSVESVSSFDPSQDWQFQDGKGNKVAPPQYRDADGNMQDYDLENKMDLQRALADGHTISYHDAAGEHHVLSGQDKDIRFAAAMALGSAGDVAQIRKMNLSTDADTRKLAKIAIASNEGAFIGKAPDLTSKPNRIAFGEGLTYSDVSSWHGSTIQEAVNFQSQTANFLGNREMSQYNEQLANATAAHQAAGLTGTALESAARADANSWAAANISAEWSKAGGTQANSQKALLKAMDTMANDPRRTDTRNQDKIDKYEKATGITL